MIFAELATYYEINQNTIVWLFLKGLGGSANK